MLEGDLAASKAELKEWIQWSSLAKSDGILPATMLEQLHVEEAALVGGGRGLPRSRDSLDAAVSPLHILLCVCDVFSSLVQIWMAILRVQAFVVVGFGYGLGPVLSRAD